MTAAALVLLVNVVSSVLKKWVYPKFGKLGVQVVVFVASALGAVYWTYRSRLPGLENLITVSLGIFSVSVTFYEVILSRLPIFKLPELSGRTD